MSDLNLALTESRSLRGERLSKLSNDKALDALNKAKSLVMAFWKGENVATTSAIAEFYEVSEDTVRQSAKRCRKELDLDGLRVLRGNEIKDIAGVLNISPNRSNLMLWNPRCALRLGMMLKDSAVAQKLKIELGYLSNYSIDFREHNLEALASKEYTEKRQHQLPSKRRVDIIDGVCITELKKGRITARHVGQLFEYLSETGLKQGRLIGLEVSVCAIDLCLILQKGGYLIELVTYQLCNETGDKEQEVDR